VRSINSNTWCWAKLHTDNIISAVTTSVFFIQGLIRGMSRKSSQYSKTAELL
jgi:hypothetical protein